MKLPLIAPAEVRAARALTNAQLAQRVDTIAHAPRSYPKGELSALLTEAARRLRWADVYEAANTAEADARDAANARMRVCHSCGEFANVDPGYSTGTCSCGAIVS